MELPFTTEQFLEVFKAYNTSIWPAQVVAYLLGGTAVYTAIWKRGYSDRIISLILAAFWLWMGGMYHLTFFAPINTAAYGFGVLFIIQGLLFFYFGFLKRRLAFRFAWDRYSIAGAILIFYAMLIYPLIGAQLGHGYPYAPMFGVAPCPATIFTFGMLLWTAKKIPMWIIAIPAVWSVIGFTAAIELGIAEDIGLLVAAVLGVGMLLVRRRASKRVAPTN